MSYEGIVHIGSDDYVSRYEFALKIADIFSLDKYLISPINTNSLYNNLDHISQSLLGNLRLLLLLLRCFS